MFDDVYAAPVPKQKDDIIKDHYSDLLQKKTDSDLIDRVASKNIKAKAEEERFLKRKAELEEADFEKENRAAIDKALKKKALEEKKRREEYYKKQEELRAKEEWEQHKKADEKKDTPFLSIFGKKNKEIKEKDALSKENDKLREMAYMDNDLGIYNANKYKEDIKHIPIKNLAVVIFRIRKEHIMDNSYMKTVSDAIKDNLGTDNIYKTDMDTITALIVNADMNDTGIRIRDIEDALKEKSETNNEGITYEVSFGISKAQGRDKYKDVYDRALEKIGSTDNPDKSKTQNKAVEIKAKPVKEKKVKVPRSNNGSEYLAPIEFKPNPKKEEDIPIGSFISDGSDEKYFTGKPTEAARSAKEAIVKIQNEIEADKVEDMMADMKEHEKNLIIIGIVNQSFDKLFIMNDLASFINVINKLNDEIALSYIYAVYKNTNEIKYYMNKPDEPIVKNILSDIGALYKNNKVVTGQMIANIQNINLFTDLYIQ